jgi:orotate phosphoribosyltransferase
MEGVRMSARDRLRELFRDRALQFGEFTLASGKKSSYYVNSKKVLFHAEAISLLGELLYESTADLQFQAIGGLEVGAIPMSAAALTAFHRHGRTMEGFFVRKHAKEHGSKERLEGQVRAGDAVVVIDDVLTTGGSVVQAIEVVEAFGAKVLRVVCICDRLQGAREALAKYDFRPIFTIRDFGIEPPTS